MSDTPADHRPPSPPRRGWLLREMVGAELRRIRLEQHRTLAEVAAAANLSLAYLSEIERGLKEASSEVLAALCAALGIQLGDLLDGVQFELERARPDQSIISVIPTAPTIIPTTPPGRYAGPTMCAA